MKTTYNGVVVPADGKAIGYANGVLQVPDNPIIPFIEGDGTGRDIWKASRRVFDAAVQKAYGGKKRVVWFEVFAGEKAFNTFKQWLPDDTVEAARDFRVSIKGPLTTPVGGGIRSLNVALRQILDLYACVRPVRYFTGVPSPVREPEKMDVVIFRENTEDVYIGIEWKSGTPEVKKLLDFLNNEMLKDGKKQIRWDSGVGIKPISPTGTKRLMRRAMQYALDNKRPSVTIGAQGKHSEVYRRCVPRLGLRPGPGRIPRANGHGARKLDPGQSGQELGAGYRTKRGADRARVGSGDADFKKTVYAEVEGVLDAIGETHGKGQWKKKLMINDRIADSVFQQMLLRPNEYSVLATSNLNGDYLERCVRRAGGRTGNRAGVEYWRWLRRV